MIVYDKLAKILQEKNMQWKDLCKAGFGVNTPAKFSHNRTMNTDNIDKVCLFLGVQPGDIMECISEEDYQKRKEFEDSEEKKRLEKEIETLQAKLKKYY